MIALALVSGIPASTWLDEGDRAVATAFDLLRGKDRRNEDGVQMSG